MAELNESSVRECTSMLAVLLTTSGIFVSTLPTPRL